MNLINIEVELTRGKQLLVSKQFNGELNACCLRQIHPYRIGEIEEVDIHQLPKDLIDEIRPLLNFQNTFLRCSYQLEDNKFHTDIINREGIGPYAGLKKDTVTLSVKGEHLEDSLEKLRENIMKKNQSDKCLRKRR